MISLAMNNVMI